MSYEKIGFVSGQKLKADHLNHIETGLFDQSTALDNMKAEIIAEAQKIEVPEIVSTSDFMVDTSKHYVNSNTGTIWAYMKQVKTTPAQSIPNFKNVFNADTAMIGYRWSGSACAPQEEPKNILSDFIPCDLSAGACILRVKKAKIASLSNLNTSIIYFSSNSDDSMLAMVKYSELTAISENNGIYAYELGDKSGTKFSGYQNTRYIRICFRISANNDGTDDSPTLAKARNVICTLNEPISYTNKAESTEISYNWLDTGIPYAPTFKTDLIGVLGEQNVIYLSENLPNGTYTLKYGDSSYDTVGTIIVE
jgi:hypothetical protein